MREIIIGSPTSLKSYHRVPAEAECHFYLIDIGLPSYSRKTIFWETIPPRGGQTPPIPCLAVLTERVWSHQQSCQAVSNSHEMHCLANLSRSTSGLFRVRSYHGEIGYSRLCHLPILTSNMHFFMRGGGVSFLNVFTEIWQLAILGTSPLKKHFTPVTSLIET